MVLQEFLIENNSIHWSCWHENPRKILSKKHSSKFIFESFFENLQLFTRSHIK